MKVSFDSLMQEAIKAGKTFIYRPNNIVHCLNCNDYAFPMMCGSRVYSDVPRKQRNMWFQPQYCVNCIG